MSVDNKLLVAEDSETQTVYIRSLLDRAGFDVTMVANGRLALDSLRDSLPDMVVTDLEMPEMNGLDLVDAIHSEFSQLPVVLITARGSEEIAAEALKRGAASYVPKRNLESDLVPTLNRILQVVHADQANQRLDRCIVSSTTEFVLENELSLIPIMIARLQQSMRSYNLFDEGQLIQIGIALDEALTNAVVHGNLEVSSDLREVDEGKAYHRLIEERRQQTPYSERRVYVRSCISKEHARIVIRDEGPGFDPKLIPDPTDPGNLEKVSGRGLLLIQSFMDDISHNAVGNEITLSKSKSAVPA
ncbi:MAG: ATP-binding protein [bacterium]|nr:ATP-binding protein [bacterium]